MVTTCTRVLTKGGVHPHHTNKAMRVTAATTLTQYQGARLVNGILCCGMRKSLQPHRCQGPQFEQQPTWSCCLQQNRLHSEHKRPVLAGNHAAGGRTVVDGIKCKAGLAPTWPQALVPPACLHDPPCVPSQMLGQSQAWRAPDLCAVGCHPACARGCPDEVLAPCPSPHP